MRGAATGFCGNPSEKEKAKGNWDSFSCRWVPNYERGERSHRLLRAREKGAHPEALGEYHWNPFRRGLAGKLEGGVSSGFGKSQARDKAWVGGGL